MLHNNEFKIGHQVEHSFWHVEQDSYTQQKLEVVSAWYYKPLTHRFYGPVQWSQATLWLSRRKLNSLGTRCGNMGEGEKSAPHWEKQQQRMMLILCWMWEKQSEGRKNGWCSTQPYFVTRSCWLWPLYQAGWSAIWNTTWPQPPTESYPTHPVQQSHAPLCAFWTGHI